MALQIRRGTDAERQLIIPLQGELIFTTDTKKLYVGDGATQGGIAVDLDGDGGASILNDLNDVSISSPSTGEVLKYQEGEWVNSGELGSIQSPYNELYVNDTGNISIGPAFLANEGASFLTRDRFKFINEVGFSAQQIFHTVSDSNEIFSSIEFERSRGSYSTQAPAAPGDNIHSIKWRAHSGLNLTDAAAIVGKLDPRGIVLPDAVPGRLELCTGSEGYLVPRLILDHEGRSQFYGRIVVYSESSRNAISCVSQNENVIPNVVLARSHGTLTSPTTLIENDTIFNITYLGHNGTTFRNAASIEAKVTGPVTSNAVPTSLTIKTTGTSGTEQAVATFGDDQTLYVDSLGSLSGSSINVQSPVTAPSITASRYIKFPSYATPAERDAAITDLEIGMVVLVLDSTGAGGPTALQAYTSTGWINL